jgi:hypothetical protein
MPAFCRMCVCVCVCVWTVVSLLFLFSFCFVFVSLFSTRYAMLALFIAADFGYVCVVLVFIIFHSRNKPCKIFRAWRVLAACCDGNCPLFTGV